MSEVLCRECLEPVQVRRLPVPRWRATRVLDVPEEVHGAHPGPSGGTRAPLAQPLAHPLFPAEAREPPALIKWRQVWAITLPLSLLVLQIL